MCSFLLVNALPIIRLNDKMHQDLVGYKLLMQVLHLNEICMGWKIKTD